MAAVGVRKGRFSAILGTASFISLVSADLCLHNIGTNGLVPFKTAT
jgi:hypothetical protein